MADFSKPFQRTLKFEGITLENVPGDPGGLTYCGIARNKQPDWEGWPLIDIYLRSAPDFATAKHLAITDQEILGMAQAFYKHAIWDQNSLGMFFNQELATQVYDAVTNIGQRAVMALQKLVYATPDGNIGPVSLHAINVYADQDSLVNLYLVWRKGYYETLVQEKPQFSKFINGWLARCVRSDK